MSLLGRHQPRHRLGQVRLQHLLPLDQLDVEAVQHQGREQHDGALGNVPPGAVRHAAAKGLEAVALREARAPLPEEPLRVEGAHAHAAAGRAEHALVHVQLAVRHHEAVAPAEHLAADDRVRRDEADRGRKGREPQHFVPHGVEARDRGVQVRQVDAPVRAEGRGRLLPHDREEGRRFDEVGQQPERGLAAVGVNPEVQPKLVFPCGLQWHFFLLFNKGTYAQ